MDRRGRVSQGARGQRTTMRGRTTALPSTPRRDPTIADLYKLMEQNQSTLKENTSHLNNISSRMTVMESRIDHVENRILSLEDQRRNACSYEDMQWTVKGLRDDMEETRQRLSKKDNAMIFGIPEGDAGEILFNELMSILLPNDQMKIQKIRVGEIYNGNCRPILVCTGTEIIKREMFNNLQLISGLEKFMEVNVKHDFTRKQRIDNRKRLEEDDIAGQHQSGLYRGGHYRAQRNFYGRRTVRGRRAHAGYRETYGVRGDYRARGHANGRGFFQNRGGVQHANGSVNANHTNLLAGNSDNQTEGREAVTITTPANSRPNVSTPSLVGAITHERKKQRLDFETDQIVVPVAATAVNENQAMEV